MTPEESLKLLEDRQKELNLKQEKVYQEGDKYFVDNDECMECGRCDNKLEARHCGNGYLSWRCDACWEKQRVETH